MPGPRERLAAICACFLAVTFPSVVRADPVPTHVTPDPPARTAPAQVVPTHFGPSWNLDGLYLWLGPSGAAGSIDAHWDSLFGADATVIRVREREPLGVLGVSFGGSRWTEHTGSRIWLDALVGTRVGRMVGLSMGPLVEFADTMHPRVGGSIGAWAFLGLTPYVRVGVLSTSGTFAEIGIHIALPVLRH